jgi:hypothetical protein
MAGFTSDLAEGRVPGQGAGQNDTFPFAENVDPTHPGRLYYVLPSNSQRVVSAKLSFWPLTYRTYNNFSATTTGGQSVTHTHGSASHAHTIPIDAGPFANAVGQNAAGGNLSDGFGPTTAPVNATTPGATGGASIDHSHLISVTSTLGITEGAVAAGMTVLFDGVDRTAVLGGPWSGDVIEMDVTKYVQDVSRGVKHLISLTSTTLGQIQGHLRLSFYSSSAQGG